MSSRCNVKEITLDPLEFTNRKLGNGLECKIGDFMFTITEAKLLKVYGDNTFIARFGWAERMEIYIEDYLCKCRSPLRDVTDAIKWCEELRLNMVKSLLGDKKNTDTNELYQY